MGADEFAPLQSSTMSKGERRWLDLSASAAHSAGAVEPTPRQSETSSSPETPIGASATQSMAEERCFRPEQRLTTKLEKPLTPHLL